MNDDEKPTKIFQVLEGGKGYSPAKEVDTIPQHVYLVTDVRGDERYAEGFLIFTSQHVAIMQDRGQGAIPVLLLPLDQVQTVELVEDEDGDVTVEMPF